MRFTKTLLVTAVSLTFKLALAQDGVLIDYVGSTRDNSAILDIRSSDQGVLVPRISIPNLNGAAPVSSPATGLLVWNMNPSTGAGYYYWSGSGWTRLMSGNTTPLTGSGAATRVAFWDGTNALTSDANGNLYWDDSNDELGIGTNNPSQKLHVVGNGRFTAVAGSGVRSLSVEADGDLTTAQPTSGSSGFWTKSGNTLSPTDAADNIDMNAEEVYDFTRLTSTSNATMPRLILDSRSDGNNWTNQGAYISLGESGDLGSAALHMTYRGDGYGFIGSGAVSNAEPGASYLRFDYNANNIYTPDNVSIGTASTDGQLTVSDRVEFLSTTDASGTAGTGVLEIGNSLRIDGDEVITNTGDILYLNNDNGGDVNMDGNTLRVDASANRVAINTAADPNDALMINGWIGRTAHNNGALVGSYNNVGANGAQTNPIYTIGTSYKPAATTLGNMYGIGYASGGSASYLTGGASGWGMYVAADGDARVFLSGAENGESYIGVNAGSRFGVGTNNPTTDLDVNGTVRLRGGAPGVDKVLRSDANGVGTWVDISTAGIGDNLGNHSATQTLDMNNNRIDDVGEIYFESGETILDGTDMRFSSNSGYMDFRPSDGTHGLIIRDFDGSGTAWSGIRTQDDGAMELGSDGGGYTQLVLADDGNVGVGTNNPEAKLNVVGNTAGDGGWDDDGIIVENTNGSTGEAAVSFKNNATGTSYWQTGLNQSAHYDISYGTSFTNGNTKMRIETDGDVGIGTVTPSTTLDVNGTVRIRGGSPEVGDVLTATSTNGTATWSAGVPKGTIVAWHKNGGGGTLPAGWQECDGSPSSVNGVTIPNLNGGTTSNSGDASRGRFLRGHTSSGLLQTDRSNNLYGTNAHDDDDGSSTITNIPDDGNYSSWAKYYRSNDAVRYRHDGVETRVTNMTVVWIIKTD